MRSNHRRFRAATGQWVTYGAAFAAFVVIPISNVTVAFAQATVQGPTPAPAPTGGGTPAPATTTTTTTVFGPYAPPSGPMGKLPPGGGNATGSSSRPRVGDETDSFDINYGGGGGGTAFGGENGPIFTDGGTRMGGDVPGLHTVRKGDTLWGICDSYFQNPYQWPRIWSYNPQIQNPHWIYPGDQVRLRSGAPLGGGAGAGGAGGNGGNGNGGNGQGGFTDRRRQVPNDTVFLRDAGYIDDKSDEDWGELTGAPQDKMFLTDGDDVYVHLGDGHDVKIGQELTIFRPLRNAGSGKIIQIQGAMRVTQYNPQTHIARGTLTESLDVIERGARIGPVGRRFQIVPPVRNDKEIKAHIIASVHPHNFYGQNQVVFIDQGADDGLKVGNRLFIIRRGDAWRRSLATPGASSRISPESEKMPDMEKTPGTGDEKAYPDEVIGELRVVALKAHSATTVVTQSKAELEKDDLAVARKGY
jgi:hypothetical protein